MIPLPSALYIYAAVAIGSAAAGGVTAYKVQGWRYGEQIAAIKTAQDKALISAIEGARTIESARFKGIQDAQNSAIKRAAVARTDAAAARTELDGLRNAIRTRPVCVSGDPATAGPERTDTAGLVLAQCGGAIAELAEKADRLNADRLMLIEAWPK